MRKIHYNIKISKKEKQDSWQERQFFGRFEFEPKWYYFSEKIDSQIRQALSCRKSILNWADSFWGVDNYRWEWYHKKERQVYYLLFEKFREGAEIRYMIF